MNARTLLFCAMLLLVAPGAAHATPDPACAAIGEGGGSSAILYGYDVTDGRTVRIHVWERCGETSAHGGSVRWQEGWGGPMLVATWSSNDGDGRTSGVWGLVVVGDTYLTWSWHGREGSTGEPDQCSMGAAMWGATLDDLGASPSTTHEPCPAGLRPPLVHVPWRVLEPLEDENGNIVLP